MIRNLALVCVLSTGAGFIGCGGDGESPTARNGAANVGNRSTAANTAAPSSDADSNPGPDNANTPVENPIAARRNKRLDEMRRAGADPNAPKPDIEAILQKSTRPAPENSQFSVALTDILVERRTFLNHPTLIKVEKVTEGQNKTIKVFTTDGRTIDLPDTSIEFLSTASTASILRAAKLQSPAPGTSERKSGAENRN